jgi:hypothetical protein
MRLSKSYRKFLTITIAFPKVTKKYKRGWETKFAIGRMINIRQRCEPLVQKENCTFYFLKM